MDFVFEAGLVVLLFLGYVALWRIKQRQQKAETGQDPEVMYRDIFHLFIDFFRERKTPHGT